MEKQPCLLSGEQVSAFVHSFFLSVVMVVVMCCIIEYCFSAVSRNMNCVSVVVDARFEVGFIWLLSNFVDCEISE